MKVELWQHQIKAIGEMHNGCILRGGVGSGKSRTSIAYFFTKVMGGRLVTNGVGETGPFANPDVVTLLIITPAKKRDGLEWEHECSDFGLGSDPVTSFGGVQVIVDSWNNVHRYVDIRNAFVIFDEQRLVGSGAWVKAFYKIAANNPWILLSATPGDNWMDYIPVFVANGFYRNRTEFIDRHVIYSTYTKFPKVKGYLEEARLYKLSRRVLVEMPFASHTRRHIRTIPVGFDPELYATVGKTRWNPYTDEPIQNAAALIYVLRRVANTGPERLTKLKELHDEHPKLIVFYNFTYELEALRGFLSEHNLTYAEWNGQKHQDIPDTDSWIYLVQYTSGSDAWNCIETDTMLFYSLQYSYRTFEQCQGRIDRLNTLFSELWYYVFRSNSLIDQAIWRAIQKKENFNERIFSKEQYIEF